MVSRKPHGYSQLVTKARFRGICVTGTLVEFNIRSPECDMFVEFCDARNSVGISEPGRTTEQEPRPFSESRGYTLRTPYGWAWTERPSSTVSSAIFVLLVNLFALRIEPRLLSRVWCDIALGTPWLVDDGSNCVVVEGRWSLGGLR